MEATLIRGERIISVDVAVEVTELAIEPQVVVEITRRVGPARDLVEQRERVIGVSVAS